MAIWLVRAGSHGEYENKFIQEARVYLTWQGFAHDLRSFPDKAGVITALAPIYPDAKPRTLQNWASQIWSFGRVIAKGDLVVVPQKTQPAFYVGEVTGEYQFDPTGPDPYYHWRTVKWVGEAVPRTHFSEDLRFSFGAIMTICRIQRNDAEARLAKMHASGWKPEPLADAIGAGGSASTGTAKAATTKPDVVDATDEATSETPNLEELARDQIAKAIVAKFKGHGLARLVDAILRAQGYTTYLSPEGPDNGVDILAGTGPLGFGAPRLCVQVKSQDSPVESKALNELRGAMTTVHAEEGLFVAWGGFKHTVTKQEATSFFKVRLWTAKEVLEQLFACYERLDADLKAELPLKRIWTVAAQEE